MRTIGFAVFDTAIGVCGIAWGGSGIVAVRLPERTADKMRARLTQRFPQAQEMAPPDEIQRVIADIVALLSGEPRSFADAPLDMTEVPAFNCRVYEIARGIPPGRTLTYGEIAVRLGDRLLARDVGQALGKNPFPVLVPCHRVLAAGSKTGGFSLPGGVTTKLRMLTIEGANPAGPTLFDDLPLVARSTA